MKRVVTFGISLLLLLTLLSHGLLSVAAAGDPTIVLTDATGMPGQTVAVTIRLENNPGLISAKVKVGYDDTALELVKCDLGGFPASGYSTGKLENQPFVVNFCDGVAPGNYTADTFATLHFRIKEDAVPDVYPLTMSCDFEGDFFDFDWDAVYFDLDQGSITVVPSTNPVTPTTSPTHTSPSATEGVVTPDPTDSRPAASATTRDEATVGTQHTHRPTQSTAAGSSDAANTKKPLTPAAVVMMVPIVAAVVAASIGVVLIIRRKKK